VAGALSCNVFLQYQVIARRVAVEHSVPVIDLILAFQSEAAEPLFMDPAHPSPEARDLIARAVMRQLRPEILEIRSERRHEPETGASALIDETSESTRRSSRAPELDRPAEDGR